MGRGAGGDMVNAFFGGAGIAAAAAAGSATSEAAAMAGKAFGDLSKKFAWQSKYPGGFSNQLTRREAFLVLGLREGSNRNKVREAHKKLMIANHPDSGGSPFLAAKVNEAKDFILSGRT